jgi:hypothetical protein
MTRGREKSGVGERRKEEAVGRVDRYIIQDKHGALRHGENTIEHLDP